MSTVSYSVDQLREAVLSSKNFRQVLLKLNKKAKGGNYAVAKRQCEKANISYIHLIPDPLIESGRKDTPPPTIDEIKKVVLVSFSWRQVARQLGLAPVGSNTTSLRDKCRTYNIDHSHFTGAAHRKGKTGFKVSTELYLNNTKRIDSRRLKERLIREGVFEHKCYRCLLVEWQGEKIPVELEHINGNHDDNALPNLTLLCPNCHALTSTYRGRNKGKYRLL